MSTAWLAHSARPKHDIPVELYHVHIRNTLQMPAMPALEAMLPFYCGPEMHLSDRLRTALM